MSGNRFLIVMACMAVSGGVGLAAYFMVIIFANFTDMLKRGLYYRFDTIDGSLTGEMGYGIGAVLVGLGVFLASIAYLIASTKSEERTSPEKPEDWSSEEESEDWPSEHES